MKLSELFRTPFKLKGGATLNLKGFSKRVIDKEVGEGGGGGGGDTKDTEKFIKKLFTIYGQTIMPETFSMFGMGVDGYILLENISDGADKFYFLYAEDTDKTLFEKLANYFTMNNDTITIESRATSSLTKVVIEINGKRYAYFIEALH